jgi:gliding motility-associated lipoprotein GldB
MNGRNAPAEAIHIHRFDKDLFKLITDDTPTIQQQIVADYPNMLKVIGLSIFHTQYTQDSIFLERIVNHYSEENLNRLYRDAIKIYDDIENVESDLSSGFQYLKTCFPTIQIPAVYMHVSGLQQNVLIDDSLLSISIDRYLGFDYPLYKDFFNDYQRLKMTPERVVPDYLRAWLLSEFPFTGNDKMLLDRMIYEGKIKYIIHHALPKVLPEVLMGYTPQNYQWCKQNEMYLWRTIIERKHLYSVDDVATTVRYFADRPSDFISDEAPGDLGSWVGWQIVTEYMEKTKSSVEALMTNTDYQDILTKSKYKP